PELQVLGSVVVTAPVLVVDVLPGEELPPEQLLHHHPVLQFHAAVPAPPVVAVHEPPLPRRPLPAVLTPGGALSGGAAGAPPGLEPLAAVGALPELVRLAPFPPGDHLAPRLPTGRLGPPNRTTAEAGTRGGRAPVTARPAEPPDRAAAAGFDGCPAALAGGPPLVPRPGAPPFA